VDAISRRFDVVRLVDVFRPVPRKVTIEGEQLVTKKLESAEGEQSRWEQTEYDCTPKSWIGGLNEDSFNSDDYKHASKRAKTGDSGSLARHPSSEEVMDGEEEEESQEEMIET